MKIIRFYFPVLFGLVFMTASCGESSENADQEQTQEQETTEEPATETQAETVADTASLEISGNDQMQYDKDRLRVKAGQIVKLTLVHSGEMPKNAMGHNWVLLKKGTDKAAFAQDAVDAMDNDYIPQSREDEVIAYTKMLGGGESVTITFEAPEKGIYTYICSFPGHYMSMNGKLIVE